MPERNASNLGSRMPPKAERCVLAHCPLAGSGSPMCERCTGPVSWTDGAGKRRGVGGATHRSCTSCPMNGLGLPVCWAGCDGPNPEFQTDGQSMVTLGGMPDSSSYLGRMMSRDNAGSPDARMFSAMDRMLAAAILSMDAERWDGFRAACDRKDARSAARLSGVPAAAFRGRHGGWDESPAHRIMAAMGRLSAQQLEIVRGLARGLTQKRIADLASGISKQAVHTQIKRIARAFPWVVRIADRQAEK